MTTIIGTGDPVVVAATQAIRQGDVPRLQRLLADQPQPATAALDDTRTARPLLQVATDWPGHHPNGAATVQALVETGADVHARFVGRHAETPLH